MGRDRELTKVDTEVNRLQAVWIWEAILKHKLDVSVVKELTDTFAFPKGVPRLKQMAVVRQLENQLATSPERMDVEQTVHSLEALERSFEEEPVDEDAVLSKRRHKRKLSELIHDAGAEPVWKRLQQPVLELKEDLGKLRSDDAKVRGNLSALIQRAWALFGPTFLEKAEVAVLNGKYNPEGVPLAANEDVCESAEQALDQCAVEREKTVSRSAEALERSRQALQESLVGFEKCVKDPLSAFLREPEAAAEEAPESAPVQKTRSLNERHPSAQAHVWDEDEIQESPSPPSPSASRRIHLPPVQSPERTLRPRKLVTSETSGGKPRRQRKKWSDLEVEVLKQEVLRRGKGNWKVILLDNKDVFQGRTEVDIKDKWRNLEKYGLL